MKTRRRILGVAIVALWLSMVGWKVRRQYFRPELAQLADAALTLAPGVDFYALRMGNRSVGLATSRLDTVPEGFVLEDVTSLDLPALGQKGTAVTRSRVQLSPSLVMRSFSFTMNSDVGTFRASGTVDGDSLLNVEVEAGGSPQKISYRLDRPPIFSSVLPVRVAVGEKLEPGKSYTYPIFDPSTLSTRNVEVKVLERDTLVVPDSAQLDPATKRWAPAHYDTIPTWKIAEVYGGVQVASWIDEDGRIVKSSSPLGFSMDRTEYELAQQDQQDAQKEGAPTDDDVILNTAIQSNVDLGKVEEHGKLRFLLSGVDLSGFDLSGGRQELRGDTLIVRREDWDSIDPGYALPYKKMDLKASLEPEPLIQSDDPRIRDRARQITTWATTWHHDPKTVTRQLTMGVFHMLKKKITFSIPSALQVLQSKQGDCNEHTVLFVAFARSLGLPARTAVGLVYLRGSFYYHAWPEVWLGKWVAVDPTFGQYPADASHIRFVIGGLAQQVELVRLIGRLRIQVVGDDGTVASAQPVSGLPPVSEVATASSRPASGRAG